MTPEQQRIAIAEACGWKQVQQSDGDYITGPSPVYPWTNGKDWVSEDGEDLPDYLNDLNAMSEAEQVIRKNKETELSYCEILYRISGWVTFAKAAQRAEAFLKTLNV